MFGSYTDVHVERYETHIAICMARPDGSWRGIEIDNDERINFPTVELQHLACERIGLPASAADDVAVVDCTGDLNRVECHMFDPRAGSGELRQRPDESIVALIKRTTPSRFRKGGPPC